jgi:hypothetical protein
MYARLVLGYYSSWFEILDYRLDDKTGMITLLLPDETIIVHKTKCKHQYKLIHIWTIIDADTQCPTGKVQVYQCNICKKIKKIRY